MIYACAVKFIPIAFIVSTWAAGLAIILYIPKEFSVKLTGCAFLNEGPSYFFGEKKNVMGEMVSLKKFAHIQSSLPYMPT